MNIKNQSLLSVTNLIRTHHIRWVCLSGVLGGLILFFGDMLFYWGPVSNLSKISTLATGQVPLQTLAEGGQWRLTLSTVFALFASWLYIIGSISLYVVFKPAGRIVSLTCFFLFVFVSVGVGLAHTAYYAIGLAAKSNYLNYGVVTGSEAAVQLARHIFNVIGYIIYIPAIAFTLTFIYFVFKGKSLLPKWSILLLPTIIIQTQYFVIPFLPNNILKIIFMGGYVNLSLTIFFIFLTITLWKVKDVSIMCK